MADTIREDEAERLDLPAATIHTLRTVGLPHELRLAGWAGPTLFSSEMVDGRLPDSQGGYVIGSIRETLYNTQAQARFWIQRGTGTVFLEPSQFVNSDVAVLIHLLNHFCDAWRAANDFGDDDLERLIQGLTSEINRLDPVALEHANHYWRGWIEELNNQRDW